MVAERVQIAEQVSPHFIGTWVISQNELCDEIISFFENSISQQQKGRTDEGFDSQVKNSLDVTVRPKDLGMDSHEPLRNYLSVLYACHRDYLEQWPFLKSVMPKVEISSFNIQKYSPGGHFKKPHSERTTLATSHRVLAWMTYLNDVSDGGTTTFMHQNLSIQPQKGLTLIWPAEWTHAHVGNIVNSGEKYIITGWMHFPQSVEQTS